MIPVPPYIEIVSAGKTRVLLRFLNNDWPWHRFEVRFSDLTETEWEHLHDNTRPFPFIMIIPRVEKKGRIMFDEIKCSECFIGVPEDRKTFAIRA